MLTPEEIRNLKTCLEARRYFSEQAAYWRKQGDEKYARECERDLAYWQTQQTVM